MIFSRSIIYSFIVIAFLQSSSVNCSLEEQDKSKYYYLYDENNEQIIRFTRFKNSKLYIRIHNQNSGFHQPSINKMVALLAEKSREERAVLLTLHPGKTKSIQEFPIS